MSMVMPSKPVSASTSIAAARISGSRVWSRLRPRRGEASGDAPPLNSVSVPVSASAARAREPGGVIAADLRFSEVRVCCCHVTSRTRDIRNCKARCRVSLMTLTSNAPVDATASVSSRRWWTLATVALAQLMVVLDATVVNIALPAAQADLGFSNGDRQWVITAYSIAFGSLLLLGGRLSDLVGRKRIFIIGLIGFAAASALGGAATTFGMLVGARALQGAFAAVLAPTALAVLTTTFTIPKERARAFGVFGAIAGAGGAVGLLLGGVLTQQFNWRWNLYINVPIAIIAVIGTVVLVQSVVRTGPRPKLDIPGTVLVSGALFFLVYGFSNAETEGWESPLTWGMLVASGVLLVAFVLWQLRARHPLLPLSIVLDRNRGAAFASVLIAGAGMFGIFLFVTYY